MAPGTPPPADPPATAIQAAARLLADGATGEAARRLEALVEAAPAYPAAQVLLAKAYEAAERWDDALGAWHQAYFLVPGSPLVRRERQRLLDAQVRAALPADWSPPAAVLDTEPGVADAPEVDEAEVDAPEVDEGRSEPLAEEPGGTLPDAHRALAPDAEDAKDAEFEPSAGLVFQEGEPGTEDVEAGAEGTGEAVAEGPPDAPEDESETSGDESEPAGEDPSAGLPYAPASPYEAPPYEPLAAPGEGASPADLAEPVEEIEHATPPAETGPSEPAAETVEPEEVELYGVDEEGDALWVSPGPAVSRALDESPIEPPDLNDEAAEPVAGADGEAGWWQRTASAEPDEEGDDIEGWTIVDETEARQPPSPFADAAIAPPAAAPEPEPEEPESTVEDARVVEDEPDEPPAPAHPVEAESGPDHPEAPTVADELDALIQQLEGAPRIRPDPAFRPPSVVFDERIADDMVSETLARIYAAQHQYAEAAIVYEKLAQQKPERAEELLRRAAELRARGGHA